MEGKGGWEPPVFFFSQIILWIKFRPPPRAPITAEAPPAGAGDGAGAKRKRPDEGPGPPYGRGQPPLSHPRASRGLENIMTFPQAVGVPFFLGLEKKSSILFQTSSFLPIIPCKSTLARW